MESDFGTSVLQSAKVRLPDAKLRQVDLYRALDLTPDRQVQGGDIVRFVELLISITQARVVLWKALNKSTIRLNLIFRLERENQAEPINPQDTWNIILEKIPKEKKVFFGLFSIYRTHFGLQVSNKFHHHPEDTGHWEVLSKEKQNLLSMRLEMLWDVVFANRLRRKGPIKE